MGRRCGSAARSSARCSPGSSSPAACRCRPSGSSRTCGATSGPDAVHPFVSRLRGVLGATRSRNAAAATSSTATWCTVDADTFVDEVDAGRRPWQGRRRGRRRRAGSALARWNGSTRSAVADVADVAVVDAEADRLGELRVAAAEALADAHVRLGRGGEDVDRLGELVLRYPLREPLAARLVTALYAAGRQADALAAYERCRRGLAEQLGVEPAAAAAPRARGGARPGGAGVVVGARAPRCGRTCRSAPGRSSSGPSWSRCVEAALDDAGRRPVVLYGMPGAGKTELACELAHRRRRAGRVAWWVAAEDPAGTAAGLDDLAAALGIGRTGARGGHPRRAVGRAGPLAGLGAGLRQRRRARPSGALPAHRRARRRHHHLRDQAWRRLARPIPVPSLPAPEAVAYVVERSGDPDTAAAGELADLLGDLPLALQQACAYVEQTGMTVPDYVRLFRGHRAELGAVATTWGLAFDRLRRRSPLAAGVLETMSFLAADAVDVEMLWPLADGDELDVQEAIGELLRLSLVDRKGADPAGAPARPGRRARPAARGDRGGAAGRRGAAVPGRRGRRRDAAAHLVQVAAHSEALRARACRSGRRAGRRGAPVRRTRPLPGRRAGARRGAAAAGHLADVSGSDHPARRAAVSARRGARRRGQAERGARPAPPRGRAAGRRAEGRRPRARARLQPPRPRPQLRRRHRGRDRGARAVAQDAARRPPRRPRRARAGRPRLHAAGPTACSTGRARRSPRAATCSRPTVGTGRTPRPGSAWWPRTGVGSRRPWRCSGWRSTRSPGSAAPTTPTPRRRWTSSATRCGSCTGPRRRSSSTGGPSRCSCGCSATRTPGSR